MSTKRMYYLMVSLCIMATAGLVGSAVVGNQFLQKQSQKLTDLKVEAAVVEQQQTALAQAKRDIETYAELNDIAKQIVPQDKDQARAVREIIAIAEQSGIRIQSVTFPASNLGQTPARSAPSASSSSGDSDDTPAPAAPTMSQVKPVEGITGVFQLELTVTTDMASPITYTQLIQFLSRLEQNRRTAQITNLAIQPTAEDRNLLTISLQLTIYIKP